MNDKYLYFRTESDIGADDGVGNSICFPLSNLAGMGSTADGELTLYFKSVQNRYTAGANEVCISDSVVLSCANNTQKDLIKDLVEVFSSNKKGMIVIADDGLTSNVTDRMGPEYISTGITACGTITQATANS